jgi:hypothetical protein
VQVVIDRTSTQFQCLFHHICSFRRRRKAYFWSYPRVPGEYSTLAGILQLQFLMKQGYLKVVFFPAPPLEKGEKVGTPHTPPRGGSPLDPCFARLLNGPTDEKPYPVYTWT